MNLMEESFQNNEKKKKRKAPTILLIAIFFVLIAIISISVYLLNVKKGKLKIYLNGQINEKIKDVLWFKDDGTIAVQIKGISEYLDYTFYRGNYEEKSEERSECYVKSNDESEIANFELGTKKIYKLDLTKDNQNNSYEYFYADNEIESNNGELYASASAIGKAFNASFEYDKDKNTITILTMQYLVDAYSTKVLDFKYKELSNVLSNKKAILSNMLVAKKDDKTMGVIKASDGTAILEPKYDSITYLPSIGDYIVESNKKFGILSSDGKTKIKIVYDSIELLDQDAKLYLVKRDNKYGVIDFYGDLKIDTNYDEVGMDISKFDRNDIKNKYILAGNLIPVRQGSLWGMYDKDGKQATYLVYDNFGYIATSSKNTYNLLIIPDYNVIVACRNKKYTLLNSYGKELFNAPVADDIYMTIKDNTKKYTIYANNNTYDAIEFLNSIGINPKKKEEKNTEQENSTSKNNTVQENENNINKNSNNDNKNKEINESNRENVENNN